MQTLIENLLKNGYSLVVAFIMMIKIYSDNNKINFIETIVILGYVSGAFGLNHLLNDKQIMLFFIGTLAYNFTWLFVCSLMTSSLAKYRNWIGIISIILWLGFGFICFNQTQTVSKPTIDKPSVPIDNRKKTGKKKNNNWLIYYSNQRGESIKAFISSCDGLQYYPLPIDLNTEGSDSFFDLNEVNWSYLKVNGIKCVLFKIVRNENGIEQKVGTFEKSIP